VQRALRHRGRRRVAETAVRDDDGRGTVAVADAIDVVVATAEEHLEATPTPVRWTRSIGSAHSGEGREGAALPAHQRRDGARRGKQAGERGVGERRERKRERL
jgi:hypothetical protein